MGSAELALKFTTKAKQFAFVSPWRCIFGKLLFKRRRKGWFFDNLDEV